MSTPTSLLPLPFSLALTPLPLLSPYPHSRRYYNDCVDFAKALIQLKCSAYTVVNCIGFNSPEWLIANNGAT